MATAAIEVRIGLVRIGPHRLRPFSEEQVTAIMASIREVGLINPITIFGERAADGILIGNGYQLVAGANRLEACRRLGRDTIPAVLLALDDLHRQLVEVDENLCGAKLTPAERALFTRRRKEIYVALHPETRHGAAGRGRPKEQSAEIPHSNSPAERFTLATATAIGVNEDTVKVDAARGVALGDEVLAAVKGTSLDKGVELDALKALPPAERAPLVERARAGEPVSARRQRSAEPDARHDNEEDALLAFAEALATHFGRREYPALAMWCRVLKLTRLERQLVELGVIDPAGDRRGGSGSAN